MSCFFLELCISKRWIVTNKMCFLTYRLTLPSYNNVNIQFGAHWCLFYFVISQNSLNSSVVWTPANSMCCVLINAVYQQPSAKIDLTSRAEQTVASGMLLGRWKSLLMQLLSLAWIATIHSGWRSPAILWPLSVLWDFSLSLHPLYQFKIIWTQREYKWQWSISATWIRTASCVLGLAN